MSKFVSIEEAALLSGVSTFQVRSWIRQVKLYGTKEEKMQIQKKKGTYRLSLAFIDAMMTTAHGAAEQVNATKGNAASADQPNDHLLTIVTQQLAVKDQQIAALHDKLDGFLARIRELHVIVHELQQKAIPAVPDSTAMHESTYATPVDSGVYDGGDDDRRLKTLSYRAFHDWMAAFVRGEKDR